MQKNLKKVLSLLLALLMAVGVVTPAGPAFAAEAVSISDLPETMDGLSIAYPYNTETVQLTGTPVSRFEALTFESARGEVESAQMILTPNFAVTSFELTMNSLKNENGNIIPGWAFDVYTQHYVSVSDSGNAANYSSTHNMYHPKDGKTGLDGTYPDGLIPQDAAIAAGEHTISAGDNQGIWVNLNVGTAAPGTYTGFATLTVNGNDMQIPVNVRIYDVTLPEEVHTNTPMLVQWDQVEIAEGKIDRTIADSYFNYLVSKRIMPYDVWALTKFDDSFADYAASYLADAPEISSYSLHYVRNAEDTLDTDALKTTLTILINKNLELAQSGKNTDLFKKAYLYVIDEPAGDAAYGKANTITAELESVKNELAPLLAAYPQLQESFMGLKHIVTAPNPTDKTYTKVGSFWNYFINEQYGDTPLTGNSYIYVPQFQWFHTEYQRNLYANESELWWYGCCHPVAPYPTYQVNTPLIAARAIGWMMYDYGIDGNLYWSVNSWNQYDYQYNSYSGQGTPGDGVLLLPGSVYGVDGPIGTIRIENIREGNEDYEYLWMLENVYGITDISAYTANMYSGVIPSTDASIHYNNRKNLLTKLEELNVAANGATQIAPGQEGFVRGQVINAGTSNTYSVANTEEVAAISFEYKIVSGNSFNMAILPNSWSSYYGYYTFTADGVEGAGITCIPLDDGYIRVYMILDVLDAFHEAPGKVVTDLYKNAGDAAGYIDNIQLYSEIPEIPEAPEIPEVPEEPVGVTYEIAAGLEINVEAGAYDYISFEYQVTNDGVLYIGALSPDWGKYYGYYEFDANGKVWNDNGVYCTDLGDGYYRVILNVSQLERTNNVSNTENAPETIGLLYVGGSNTATGTIRNVVLSDSCVHIYESVVTAPEVGVQGYTTHTCTACGHSYVDSYVDALQPEVPDAVTYDISTGLTISVEAGTYDYISFEYQVTNDGVLYIGALSPDWGKYYGYYEFNANGKVWNDKGVYCADLGDGYYRVILNVSQLERTNNVSNTENAPETIGLLYVGGSNTAAGTIRNVQLSDTCAHIYESVVTLPTTTQQGYTTHTCTVCGNSYVDNYVEPVSVSYEIAGDTQVDVEDGAYSFISFEYQITNEGVLFIGALSPDWCKYYGYYEFDANGKVWNDKGVYCTDLGDGHYRVILNISQLERTNSAANLDNAPETIGLLYISGSNSAIGTICNVRVYNQNDCSHNYDAVITEPSFAANGYTTYTCHSCGDSYTADKTAAYTASVKEWNIALGDDISATFYVNVDSRIENPTAQIAVGKNVSSADFIKQDDGTYAVTVKVAAAQMTDDISIQVVVGDLVSDTMTYSIRQYAEKILTGEYNAKTKNLVKAMLNYGAMAQTYFGYNTGDLANKDYVNTDAVEIPAVDTSNMVSGSVDGIRFYGASLVFESKVAVRFYFTVTGDINSYTFSTGTPVAKNGMYYIEVPGINPQDYANTITLIVNDTLTVSYSPLTYIFRKASDTNEDLANLVKAMYTYHLAAFDYVPDPVVRGDQITAGTDMVINLGNTDALETLSFDYKVSSGTFNVALKPDQSSYFGYFAFDTNGTVDAYDGVALEALDDGYTRVTFNIPALTKYTGEPSSVIDILYIRGSWSDATGYIDNVQIKTTTQPEVTYDIATGLEIDVEDGTYDYVTFDYKVTNDGVLYIAALSSDWSKYYGYYEFDVDGKVWEDQGVYCEKLDDGFFHVTLKIAELNRTNNVANLNNKPDHIGLLYVGSSNTATGIIRNVKYGVEVSAEPETPEVPDAVNVSYNFSGNEASRAGYAEGTVTVSGNLVSGRVYHFCWANAEGKLEMYRPLGSVSVAAGQSSVSLTIGENVAIPAGADRIAVYQNNGVEWAGYAMLDSKANAGQLKVKYAVVSDVHTNYNQGEKYWLNALKQFEAEGVEYIIVSGDIGESNADYAKYISAVETSGFSGVIMACIGNHDQTTTGSINFKNYAIYDGSSKTWVSIDDAPAYFANQYAGDLDISVSIDGSNKAYYFATIGDNAFMFMDQELGPDGGTTTQDNFSQQQLNFVEANLYAYSATHTLHIVEHAPIEQLKVGDKFIPGYGGCIQLSITYPNNQRFLNLLMEYTEAIWLSGHTHVQYDVGIMYLDKYYDASGNLTDTPIAHSFHVSSLAQPRWYEGTTMIMKNDYSAASQGYVCYQYENDVVYEARVFKNYTPDSTSYDENLFINEVEAINTMIVPLEKVSHDAPEVIEDLAVAGNGVVRQGSVSYEDTADGLKVTFGAASNRFEICTGNQTKAYYNGYYLQFKIKTDLTSFALGGCNYSGNRYTYIAVDLTTPGENYAITDLGDGWKFVQIPFEVLGVVDYLPEFAIRIYNTNAAGTFYLKELFISPFDYSYMRGDTFVGGVNKTVNTPVSTSDILSFEYRIIAGSKIYVAMLHDWSNYFGYYYFDANGEMQDYAGITTEVLPDGYVRVTCDVNLMTSKNGTPTTISMIYISKNGGDASGYIDNVCFDFGDSDEEEEDNAVDYAKAANGVIRAGSVSFADMAEGLQVTFAAAGNRFEIKCGDQTAAANGTLQFKIKTDLTSIKLGGCNYSGGRQTTVTVNLTASGDGYTVTDLGDGWVLVEVPMSVIGVADYLAEFAIRFYDTNAAGTFYLKDMNYVA